jgi:hypothetical protein
MLTHGEAWMDRGAARFEQRRTELELTTLNSKARAKGFKLVPITEATGLLQLSARHGRRAIRVGGAVRSRITPGNFPAFLVVPNATKTHFPERHPITSEYGFWRRISVNLNLPYNEIGRER